MQYQLNVSKHGVFLFRTDWDHDKVRTQNVYDTLLLKLKPEYGYRIDVCESNRDTSTNITGEMFNNFCD